MGGGGSGVEWLEDTGRGSDTAMRCCRGGGGLIPDCRSGMAGLSGADMRCAARKQGRREGEGRR
jgi:hypothetical protein